MVSEIKNFRFSTYLLNAAFCLPCSVSPFLRFIPFCLQPRGPQGRSSNPMP
jgi:hypothetical protein